mgnify:CR=1 FL=1
MSFANTSESQELTNDSQARGYGAPNISKAQHNRSSSKKVIPNQRVKFFLEGHGTSQSIGGKYEAFKPRTYLGYFFITLTVLNLRS